MQLIFWEEFEHDERNGFPSKWKFMEVNFRIERRRDWMLLVGVILVQEKKEEEYR